MLRDVPSKPIGPGPWRKRTYRAVALLLSVTLACAAAEVALRVAGYGRSYVSPFRSFHTPDPVLGWRGKPNFAARLTQREFDVLVAQDEHGFRLPEHPPLPSEGRRNVFVFGDSFVWGWGVGQGQLLTDKMQSLLSDCRVHNVGLCASGTVQQSVIFQQHVSPQLRPGDTVVLVFFVNDFGDNVGRHEPGCLYAKVENGEVQQVPPDGTACGNKVRHTLKDASYLFNLVTYCSDLLKCRLDAWKDARHRESAASGERSVSAVSPSDIATYLHSPEVEITRFYLAQFQQRCQAAGVRFVVASNPTAAELGEGESELVCPAPRERLALLDCAAGLALETIDLLPPLQQAKQAGRCRRVTFPHDLHWNADGQAIAAEAIAAYLSASPEPRWASHQKAAQYLDNATLE